MWNGKTEIHCEGFAIEFIIEFFIYVHYISIIDIRIEIYDFPPYPLPLLS